MTLFQDEAKKLIDTEAPMETNSLEYKVTRLIADGKSINYIAERLGEPVSSVEDAIQNVVDEFGEFLA